VTASEKQRELAQYRVQVKLQDDEAKQVVSQAERFVDAVNSYLVGLGKV
jgi:uncharacterized protein (UPF0332 family)